MKSTMKKVLCLTLSLLLLASASMGILAQAASLMTLSAGSSSLAIPTLSQFAIPDGVINENEYGSAEPMRLSIGNGLWAEDNNGNEVTEGLPEYADLYMFRHENAIYVAVGVKQGYIHPTKDYSFTTFLGFGDDAEKGATTRFQMFERDYNFRYQSDKKWAVRTCIEVRAAEVSSNGGERLQSVGDLYLYSLPCWGSIDAENKGDYTYIFEVKLDIEDSVIGSGLEWTGKVPEKSNFAFDLGLYDNEGNETGKVHFNRQKNGEAPEELPSLGLEGSDATLTDLKIPGAIEMTPSFRPTVTNYTVILPEGETAVVEAVTNDPEASFAVAGEENADPYDDYSLTVYGVAQNGAKGTAYTLHFTHKLKYTTYVATGSSLPNVIEEMKAVPEWGAGDAVEIQLFGNYVEENGILFNLPTIFRKGGTRLPIVINGFGGSSVTFNAQNIFSANNVTFKGLTLSGEANLYAGSGNLTFENSPFENDTKVSVFADPYTEEAFIGWTEENYLIAADTEGVLNTTVTFLAGSNHPASENAILASVGSSELKKAELAFTLDAAKLNPKLVIDGATVKKAAARVGSLPVPNAEVVLASGSVGRLTGDGNTAEVSNFRNFLGDTIVTVTGGEVTEFIRPLNGNNTRGSTVINVSGEPVIATILASDSAAVFKNSILNISGGTFKGAVEGSAAELSTRNNISGGTFKGPFYGLGEGGTRRVINNVKNATFNDFYYGGHKSAGDISGVSNKVENCVFAKTFFGGNRSGTLYGTIANEVVSGSFNYNGGPSYIGGNEYGVVELGITNVIRYGTFKFDFAGGSMTGIVGGDVVNTIHGGSFTGYRGGNCTVLTEDTDPTPLYERNVIRGNVINTIKGGTFANRAGDGLAFISGSRQGRIEGGIINTINAGKFLSRFLGGSCNDGAYISSTDPNVPDVGLNKYGESITNIINDGTFGGVKAGYYHFSGSLGSTHGGNISAVINGGTFNYPYYFGSRGVEEKADFIGTVNGGTFNAEVYGGSVSASHYYQNSGVTINGGTFNKAVYAGSIGTGQFKTATLTLRGGTFNANVYAGSATASASNGIAKVILDPKDDTSLVMKGEVITRGANEIVETVS